MTATPHVVFRVARERYALPLEAVREVVVRPEMVSRVPRAPEAVLGVINLRGRVVTVVRMQSLLGLSVEVAGAEKIVLLDRGRRDLGLLVSEVEGIEPVDTVSLASGPGGSAVRGVGRVKGGPLTVLDPEGVDAAVAALFA